MGKKKILIVDSDAPVAQRIAQIARTWGWAADTVLPGDGAVETAAGSEYDVVLLDVSGAGQADLEMTRRLSEAQPSADLVAMNGHEYFNMAFEAELQKLGVVYYTIKPDHDLILQRVLEHMLLRFDIRRSSGPTI